MSMQSVEDILAQELQWLQENPHFRERPATMEKFLGPDYLNIADGVRPRVREEMIAMIGDELDPHRLAKHQLAIFTGGIGIGKALRSDQRVATPSGWVPIGDLRTGDLVTGSDGAPTRVTGVFPQGQRELYEFVVEGGSTVICDGDHLWRVRHALGGPWVTVKTADLIEAGLEEPDGSPSWVIQRMSGAALTHPNGELPTSPAQHATETTNPSNTNPRISPTHLSASISDRVELMAILMDLWGDPYSAGSRNQTIPLPSEEFAEDFAELVLSLGGEAAINVYTEADGSPLFEVEFCVEYCPFADPELAAIWEAGHESPTQVRSILSIEPAGTGDATCISVEARDSLFVTEGYIVTHNTTVASIILPYMVHWCLCLRDPQAYFGLLPGSRIAFMMMSTSSSQAKEVLFADVKARIAWSPWFKNYPIDKKFANQIRFDNDIWILPGDSGETTFEGYNILGGILDEADSHKRTDAKDYAENGYETIFNRMSSRYEDRGFLLIIGQWKLARGFVAKKWEEFEDNPLAYRSKLTIWESRGDDYYEKDINGKVRKFFFDLDRKQIVPNHIVDRMGGPSSNMMEIPEVYRDQFVTNPEKALRDLAGMPPKVDDPFIRLDYKIHHARDRWVERHGAEPPVDPQGRIASWFKAPNSLKRVGHIDIGYSSNGDAAAIAMGHVERMIEVDDELKPYISIDFLYREKAIPGQQVQLSHLRQVIYSLQKKYKYKLVTVTLDGFQSLDTIQQFNRNRIQSDNLSVDKQLLPYHELREAIYEDRIEWPPYMVFARPGSTEEVEILVHELTELMDDGKKVDHPRDGSKDVADCVAAVVSLLMSNPTLHRKGSGGWGEVKDDRRFDVPQWGGRDFSHPAYLGGSGGLPTPPRMGGNYDNGGSRF